MKAWGRLLRLSLAPSALADVAAGVTIGAGAWPSGSAPWILMLASASVYHGGMALNDWADREVDRRAGRGRPLETGAITPVAALSAGIALLALGVALARLADPLAGALLGWVAALVLIYDFAPRRAWSGPLLLALCRAGNLAAAIALGRAFAYSGSATLVPLVPLQFAPAGVYGLYVLLVGWLGRFEDIEDEARIGRTPSALCLCLAAVLALAPLYAWAVESTSAPLSSSALLELELAELVALIGAFALLRAAFPVRSWSRGEVLRTMGLALRRLLVFTAVLTLASGAHDAWLVALSILAGYPLSWWLRGVFPPS